MWRHSSPNIANGSQRSDRRHDHVDAIVSVLHRRQPRIARIEWSRTAGLPMLAMMQFGGGVLLIVYFQLCSMIWLVLSFRPDLDPALAGLLDGAACLIFVMVFPSYIMQMLCMAVAAFRDMRTRLT
jgi:hypothetical protein